MKKIPYLHWLTNSETQSIVFFFQARCLRQDTVLLLLLATTVTPETQSSSLGGRGPQVPVLLLLRWWSWPATSSIWSILFFNSYSRYIICRSPHSYGRVKWQEMKQIQIRMLMSLPTLDYSVILFNPNNLTWPMWARHMFGSAAQYRWVCPWSWWALCGENQILSTNIWNGIK